MELVGGREGEGRLSCEMSQPSAGSCRVDFTSGTQRISTRNALSSLMIFLLLPDRSEYLQSHRFLYTSRKYMRYALCRALGEHAKTPTIGSASFPTPALNPTR